MERWRESGEGRPGGSQKQLLPPSVRHPHSCAGCFTHPAPLSVASAGLGPHAKHGATNAWDEEERAAGRRRRRVTAAARPGPGEPIAGHGGGSYRWRGPRQVQEGPLAGLGRTEERGQERGGAHGCRWPPGRWFQGWQQSKARLQCVEGRFSSCSDTAQLDPASTKVEPQLSDRSSWHPLLLARFSKRACPEFELQRAGCSACRLR